MNFRKIYTPDSKLSRKDVENEFYNLNCIQKSRKQHKAGFKGENITLKNQGI